jgi:hypothetical protein
LTYFQNSFLAVQHARPDENPDDFLFDLVRGGRDRRHDGGRDVQAGEGDRFLDRAGEVYDVSGLNTVP